MENGRLYLFSFQFLFLIYANEVYDDDKRGKHQNLNASISTELSIEIIYDNPRGCNEQN